MKRRNVLLCILKGILYKPLIPNEETTIFLLPGESDGFDITPRQSFAAGNKSEEPSALDLSPIAKHHDSFNKVWSIYTF